MCHAVNASKKKNNKEEGKKKENFEINLFTGDATLVSGFSSSESRIMTGSADFLDTEGLVVL